ncbi:Flagellar P-ring protein [Massilia sp. Bi118]|uniref:flagellar basal body P-ring protein FlgI n=1 Tax=Massilia sp. Bi118 TaxID=2822346 RepID=UPI001D64DEDD|nr:flagellar basal body P-ring protein FlgI [Massilia sp. Bi118]CAH0270979.1 Flagellar P-ring protein [Massilia sp. Bi118]
MTRISVTASIFRIASALLAAAIALPSFAAPAAVARPAAAAALPQTRMQPLRNLASVEGVRENPLVGYGLVVGLNGSGDSTQVKYSSQSVVNMLKQFGVKLPEGQDAKNKNVAAVMVSAVFPPGYRRGQAIDVTVSSLGDAKSLRGGTLLLTQMRAADNEVYALAQGNLVVGGLSASGKSGSSVTVNTPTGGRIPNGAQIEREIPTDFSTRQQVVLRLRHPNFDTATNVVEAINRRYGQVATTADGTSVEVIAPTNPTERVAFVAKLENMPVEAGLEVPKVVFNSRTGTVVISDGLRVKSAAITHGALKVVISESSMVSQPGPFSKGQTQVTPQSKVSVDQGSGQMFHWPAGAKLQTIIDVVNSLGASPDDIMAILQALDQAGAIEGELVVI